MNLVDAKKHIASWSANDQDQLATYLTILRLNRDENFRQELKEMKSDTSLENWMSIEEMKNRLDTE